MQPYDTTGRKLPLRLYIGRPNAAGNGDCPSRGWPQSPGGEGLWRVGHRW